MVGLGLGTSLATRHRCCRCWWGLRDSPQEDGGGDESGGHAVSR